MFKQNIITIICDIRFEASYFPAAAVAFCHQLCIIMFIVSDTPYMRVVTKARYHQIKPLFIYYYRNIIFIHCRILIWKYGL